MAAALPVQDTARVRAFVERSSPQVRTDLRLLMTNIQIELRVNLSLSFMLKIVAGIDLMAINFNLRLQILTGKLAALVTSIAAVDAELVAYGPDVNLSNLRVNLLSQQAEYTIQVGEIQAELAAWPSKTQTYRDTLNDMQIRLTSADTVIGVLDAVENPVEPPPGEAECEPAMLVLDTAGVALAGVKDRLQPEAKSVIIRNDGEGVLLWEAEKSAEWISVIPSEGRLRTGESDEVMVGGGIEGLERGTYEGTVTFTAPNATGSPAVLAVALVVG